MSLSTADGIAVLDRFNDQYAAGAILGRIGWSSVESTGRPIPRTLVADAMRDVGLESYVPDLRSPADVFRTTSKTLKTTVELPDGSTVMLDVKDVSTTSEEIVRRVVAEHRDSKAQRLSYGQTWDIRFNKATSKIDLYPITADADGAISPRDRRADPRPADDLVATLRDDFTANLNAVHPEGLRGMINRLWREAQGISVRPTGAVYFGPEEKAWMLLAMQKAAKAIPGVFFHTMLVPDDPEHTSMLEDAITSTTESDVEELLRDMDKIVNRAKEKGVPVRQSTLVNLFDRKKEMEARLTTFQELLKNNLADSVMRLEVLQAKMANLVRSA